MIFNGCYRFLLRVFSHEYTNVFISFFLVFAEQISLLIILFSLPSSVFRLFLVLFPGSCFLFYFITTSLRYRITTHQKKSLFYILYSIFFFLFVLLTSYFKPPLSFCLKNKDSRSYRNIHGINFPLHRNDDVLSRIFEPFLT